MSAINAKILKKFLQMAGDKLTGRWVIIGGAVLHFLDTKARPTVDIDIAGPREAKQKDTLKLMEIANTLGLSVESINQAGSYFLHKIKHWQDQLISLHKGKTAEFFRPNVNLYLQLKLNRMSEIDLQDCLQFLNHIKGTDENVDKKLIDKAILAKRRDKDTTPDVTDRLDRLSEQLQVL